MNVCSLKIPSPKKSPMVSSPCRLTCIASSPKRTNANLGQIVSCTFLLLDIIEDADPDASDSEFLTPVLSNIPLPGGGESEYGGTGAGSEFGGDSEMGDGATPRFEGKDGDGGGGDGFDLAAELTKYVERRSLKRLKEVETSAS